MKFGLCTNFDNIELAAQMGFDYVECAFSRLAALPVIQSAVERAVRPLTPVQRIKESAIHILKQLPYLTILDDKNKAFQMSKHSYTHARELLMIYAAQFFDNYDELADYWPDTKNVRRSSGTAKHRRKTGKHHS